MDTFEPIPDPSRIAEYRFYVAERRFELQSYRAQRLAVHSTLKCTRALPRNTRSFRRRRYLSWKSAVSFQRIDPSTWQSAHAFQHREFCTLKSKRVFQRNRPCTLKSRCPALKIRSYALKIGCTSQR